MFTIYQVADAIIDYYAYPYDVAINLERTQSVDFPAVTVCNLNAARWMQQGFKALARYVKLRVAHAPGMPGTFFLTADLCKGREREMVSMVHLLGLNFMPHMCAQFSGIPGACATHNNTYLVRVPWHQDKLTKSPRFAHQFFLPEASFRVLSASVRVSLCVPMCVPVCQPWDCPRHNSLVQASITKFAPEVQNASVKIFIVWESDWPSHSRSNFTLKAKFTLSELVYTVTHHGLKLRFLNLDQKCILALIKFLLILGLIDTVLQFHF